MDFLAFIMSVLTRIGTEFKSVRILISGTGTGDVSGLSTTATNLVGAVNEVKATADAAAGSAASLINDTTASPTTTFSGTKIAADIATAKSEAKNEIIGGLGPAFDTLAELKADYENADSTLTTLIGSKANSADVYTKVEIGDITTDLVAVFEAALV